MLQLLRNPGIDAGSHPNDIKAKVMVQCAGVRLHEWKPGARQRPHGPCSGSPLPAGPVRDEPLADDTEPTLRRRLADDADALTA